MGGGDEESVDTRRKVTSCSVPVAPTGEESCSLTRRTVSDQLAFLLKTFSLGKDKHAERKHLH